MKWFSLGYIVFVSILCWIVSTDKKNTYAGERFAYRTMLIIPAALLFAVIWFVYLFWIVIR